MLEIDGSMGEGGGQVLRSSLTLSLATGRPFRISDVRASRSTPGLRAQHLAAARAAAEVSGAAVEGAAVGSVELVFRPEALRAGDYRFATGTAGSATLVAQTVLLPLLLGTDAPSRLTLEGGTHNPSAPPYEFLDRAYLGRLRAMGARVGARLERPGFYPAGGGRFHLEVEPTASLRPLRLTGRGAERRRSARAIVSALPRHIAERELSVLHAMLSLRSDALEVLEVPEEEAAGPGNAVMVLCAFEETEEVFTGFGERGVPAEEVALELGRRVREWLASGAPVGPHLADQLLLPLALGPGGRFVASGKTRHADTQTALIARFLDREIAWEGEEGGNWTVTVG